VRVGAPGRLYQYADRLSSASGANAGTTSSDGSSVAAGRAVCCAAGAAQAACPQAPPARKEDQSAAYPPSSSFFEGEDGVDAGFGTAAATDGSSRSGADGAAAEPATCGAAAQRALIAPAGNGYGRSFGCARFRFQSKSFKYCATKSQPTLFP